MEGPHEAPFIKQPTATPHVFLCKYADAEVLELNLPDATLMRRLSDGSVNATQLLDIARIDRAQKASVLEELGPLAEKSQGRVEKCQGSYVPVSVARQLASTYNLTQIVEPLLGFDLGTVNAAPGDVSMHDEHTEVYEGEDMMTIPPLEPEGNDALIDVSREVVTELFLSNSRGEVQTLSNILARHDLRRIELDVSIDDAGHTALHWAAALAKVSLVADLVQNGANCRRGNRKGESPLVRAVLVTNSSDNQSFSDLLDLLFPCLHLGDAQGRTVLHHIALTAGIPGRSDASRYYLDTLLEWAVRRRGASGVTWLVNELVDAQDMNGDTALNIAARVGSHSIAQQLVDIGASLDLGNRAGLKPTDFGILPKQDTKGKKQTVFRALANSQSSRACNRTNVDGVARRAEIVEECAAAISQVDAELSRVLRGKNQLLQDAHSMLKSVTEKLEVVVARKKNLSESIEQRDLNLRRLAALEKAIEHENETFKVEGQIPVIGNASFDADQPFRITKESRYPPVLLRARITAYNKIEKDLTRLRDKLNASSLENEAKFRKVVAQCTSSDESKVDEILDDLLIAVRKDDNKVKIPETAQ